MGVGGGPKTGYFALALVWSRRRASFGRWSRVGSCAFQCFGWKLVSGLSEAVVLGEQFFFAYAKRYSVIMIMKIIWIIDHDHGHGH